MSAKRKPASRSTSDAKFDLVAAVQRRAILDARAGDSEAIEYLNITMPDWRERLSDGRQMHTASSDMTKSERKVEHAIQED